jgi:hypothetical protein
MKTAETLTALFACILCAGAPQSVSQHRLADSLQHKLDHIRQNAESEQPDQAPTVMTEEEINDYFAAGRAKIPPGVRNLTLQGLSGVITGSATVDFDEIRAGQNSSNPLLSIFGGVHNVRVEAEAEGSGGRARVHVRRAALDGVKVPRLALEFFVSKFVTPKYPHTGLDSEFQLPGKIDVAKIGYHKLRLIQK